MAAYKTAVAGSAVSVATNPINNKTVTMNPMINAFFLHFAFLYLPPFTLSSNDPS